MMRDIYQFGLLISAISNDWDFMKYSHFSKKDSRQDFDEDFKNFLEKCIDSDENARWSPEMLLHHSFIVSDKTGFTSNTSKKDYELRLLPIPNSISEMFEDGKANEKKYESKFLLSSIVSSGVHSRLENEFEVLDKLGKGLSIIYSNIIIGINSISNDLNL